MPIQAHLDKIQLKTGNTPDDFRKLAKKKGLTEFRDIKAWLMTDYGLDYGHANLIARRVVNADQPPVASQDRISKFFAGNKEPWRKPYGRLIAKLEKFGSDVQVMPTTTYIKLLRGDKKFGIVQPSAANRLDIGIKRKGVASEGRFEAAGRWNNTVTHRVRITDPKQLDKELVAWLKQAYKAA